MPLASGVDPLGTLVRGRVRVRVTVRVTVRVRVGVGVRDGVRVRVGVRVRIRVRVRCVTETLNILLAVTGSLKRPTSACLGQPRYAVAQY